MSGVRHLVVEYVKGPVAPENFPPPKKFAELGLAKLLL
jgi:hypothetical protein